MKGINIRIIGHSVDLPALSTRSFFHSSELFCLLEKTPGQYPYMLVAEDNAGHVAAHLLVTIRRSHRWLPPFIVFQARVYGEGVYDATCNKEEIFARFLAALMPLCKQKLCVSVEFSDISQKMFGYSVLREHRFFPVHWQEVHNSLHSRPPEQRLAESVRKKIAKAQALGVTTREACNEKELYAFYRLLKRFSPMRIRRHIPSASLFVELQKSRNSCVFLTFLHEKIIGGCVCVYSGKDAYMWFLASKQTVYSAYHPAEVTVWKAIQHAHLHHYDHIHFLDVGLPFKRNPFREFILSFGGKPVAQYRWFHIAPSWANRLLSWWYTS